MNPTAVDWSKKLMHGLVQERNMVGRLTCLLTFLGRYFQFYVTSFPWGQPTLWMIWCWLDRLDHGNCLLELRNEVQWKLEELGHLEHSCYLHSYAYLITLSLKTTNSQHRIISSFWDVFFWVPYFFAYCSFAGNIHLTKEIYSFAFPKSTLLYAILPRSKYHLCSPKERNNIEIHNTPLEYQTCPKWYYLNEIHILLPDAPLEKEYLNMREYTSFTR